MNLSPRLAFIATTLTVIVATNDHPEMKGQISKEGAHLGNTHLMIRPMNFLPSSSAAARPASSPLAISTNPCIRLPLLSSPLRISACSTGPYRANRILRSSSEQKNDKSPTKIRGEGEYSRPSDGGGGMTRSGGGSSIGIMDGQEQRMVTVNSTNDHTSALQQFVMMLAQQSSSQQLHHLFTRVVCPLNGREPTSEVNRGPHEKTVRKRGTFFPRTSSLHTAGMFEFCVQQFE